MKLSGQTELAKLESLSPAVRRQLEALWVENVEEYLGLMGALEAGHCGASFLGSAAAGPTRGLALSLVGPELGQQLSRGERGGALGCEIQPEIYERFRAERRLGSARAGAPLGLEAAGLPSAVRLFDQLGKVRDQGERGTCVAFATVALREFLDSSRPAFSEQFVYWACKELDGFPDSGTTLHTAMSALSEYGCCRTSTWPYSRRQLAGNESQGPPAAAALAEARQFRLRDCRPVEPTLAVQYKRVLAGHDGVPAMPVVLGVLVFNSWFLSGATHRSGKITLPLPDEQPVGGHAMCAVGYVDDPGVPGGGYFIVRNSWGDRWAADSPEAPGHALIPYAYVEACAVAAFTGPTHAGQAQERLSDPQFGGYLRALEGPTRDQSAPHGHGELLPKGTVVLFNPRVPGEVMRDTPDERRRFEGIDRAWTVSTRQQVWFRPIGSLPGDFQRGLDAARANQGRFLSAIEENLKCAIGTPFPKLHFPAWTVFIPYEWESKTREVRAVADLTAELAAEMEHHSGVRPDLAWPAEWSTLLQGINKLKVFEVAGFATTCRVAAAFVTPVKLVKEGDPQRAVLSQQILDAVRAVYGRWAKSRAGAAAGSTFFTLAVEGELPSHLHTPASGVHWEMLVAFQPDGSWTAPPPLQEIERLSLRNFLDRLKPETREQRLSAIRKVVDHEIKFYEGNVSESHIKKQTGHRRSQVRETFTQLEAGHPDLYRVKKLPRGELAIKRPEPGQAPPATSPGSIRKALHKHSLGVLSLAVAGGLAMGNVWLKDHLGLPLWLSFGLGILIAYFGQVVQKAINKRAEDGKD